MVLEVVKYPEKILRQKTREVKEITPEVKNFILDMLETMEKNDGAGLAAPQVGKGLSIITVNFEEENYVFLNPRILAVSEKKESAEEGCLSLPPKVVFPVERFQWVKVRAQDYAGKPFEIKAEGLLARILQHEIDHLQGTLIIDYLSPQELEKYEKYF